jgi:hypothetical protein
MMNRRSHGLRRKYHVAALEVEIGLRRLARILKFNPDQPRVPAGNPEGGQWTSDGNSGGGSGGGDSDVATIIDKAKRLNLATSPAAYQKCLDLCYRLLERPQRPGSDLNTWDFHKCMNACLKRNL